MNNPNAFPTYKNDFSKDGTPHLVLEYPGMYLLDYFAAKIAPMMYKQIAEQGVKEKRTPDIARDSELIAKYSYAIAKGMLNERENYIK